MALSIEKYPKSRSASRLKITSKVYVLEISRPDIALKLVKVLNQIQFSSEHKDVDLECAPLLRLQLICCNLICLSNYKRIWYDK
jgi:hypothetical protein